ncbi:MAG: DUF3179 domain-containing protein [Bacteroidota bacterium]
MNRLILSISLLVFIAGCKPDPVGPDGQPRNTDWLIPESQVLDGGPGKDGIPSIDQPQFVSVGEANEFLQDDDLIVGVKVGSVIRAYPHIILDWHEIVNDELGNMALAINYCPLTGTAMAWDRTFEGEVSEFGVSGLLYNTNLMPYDRSTESYWSQMVMGAVHGDRSGEEATVYPVVETTWKTWKEMYPATEVLGLETGFRRNYGIYPYGGYRENQDQLFFPVNHENPILPQKERVLAVRVRNAVRAFRFNDFEGEVKHFEYKINDTELVVVGQAEDNFLVAYGREASDGTLLDMSPVQDAYPIVLTDQEGNRWDVFGVAVSGPRSGEQLPILRSLIGYWFTFPAFFTGTEVVER